MPTMSPYEKWSLRAAWLALLLSVVMPLCVQWCRPRLSEPDVRIEFDLKPPFVIKTTVGRDARKEYYSAYLFRFGIRNCSGYYEARKCVVMLTGLWHHLKNDEFREEENFEQVQLGWGGTMAKELSYATDTTTTASYIRMEFEQLKEEHSFEGVRLGWDSKMPPDISAGMRVLAPFGRIMPPSFQRKYDAGRYSGELGKPQFRFSVPDYPRWMSSHLPPGKHRFRITLYFENRPPVQQEFELDWSGKWSDDYESMLKQIKVRKIG